MKYYKHSQLVKEYSVSDRTVRNWVEASLQGKVDLKLYEKNGRYYVADSIANHDKLDALVQKGKKYRNSRSSKTVEPTREFYEIYESEHIADLVNTLDKNRELAWEYSYFGKAAEYWNDYLMELHSAGKGNLVTNTIDTIKLNYAYLDALIEKYDCVNVVNVCVGNNIAVHDVLSRIKASGKLNRFIAADISRDMLDEAGRNIDKWFSGGVRMERCVVDIRNQPLNLITSESGADAENTINLFFMVAGAVVAFENTQRVLQTLNASMSKNDILILTSKRDTPQSRSFFDFNVQSDTSLLGFNSKYMLDLLGIDESFYDIEQGYDEKKSRKHLSVKLKVNLSIRFMISGLQKTVQLEKGESILLWKARRFSDEAMLDELSRAGFSQLLTSQSIDQQLRLTISKPMPPESRR